MSERFSLSNSDFQERLDRIKASKGQTESGQVSARAGQPNAKGPHIGLMVLGCFFIGIFSQSARFANTHYETVRDSYGLGAAVGLAIAGIAPLLIGGSLIWIWAKRRTPASTALSQASAAQSRVEASPRDRLVFSLIGLTLGVIASLLMFLSAAYRFSETGSSIGMANLCTIAALCLAAVSLMIGATGMVVRGRALLRVPACFFIGGLLTLAVVRVLRIDTHAWLEYMPQVL